MCHLQLRRQILPALLKLVNDSALGVKLAAVEGLAALWEMAAASSSLLEELHRHLDTVMSAGIHEVRERTPNPRPLDVGFRVLGHKVS